MDTEITYQQGSYPYNYVTSWHPVIQGVLADTYHTLTARYAGHYAFTVQVRDHNNKLVFLKTYDDLQIPLEQVMDDYRAADTSIPAITYVSATLEMITAHANALQQHIFQVRGLYEDTYPEIPKGEHLTGTRAQEILDYLDARGRELQMLHSVVADASQMEGQRSLLSMVNWALVWELNRSAEMKLGITLDNDGKFVASADMTEENERLETELDI